MELEILSVELRGAVTEARARWTDTSGPAGETGQWEITITKGNGWVKEDGTRLFPLPPSPDHAPWHDDRYKYSVHALDSSLDLGEHGVLRNCLEVGWHFDEGGGLRLYAPGIGLVRMFSNDEDNAYSYTINPPLERRS